MKKKGKAKLKSDEIVTLNAALDRAARSVSKSGNPDLFAKYSALKGCTNFIERIARERKLRPSNLGEYDRILGEVELVKARGGKQWSTPKAKSKSKPNPRQMDNSKKKK